MVSVAGLGGCTRALDGPAIVPALLALFRLALPRCWNSAPGTRLRVIDCS
jgi:hypothetical protein